MALYRAELTTRHGWRGQHNQTGAVAFAAAAVGVIANPDRTITQRAGCKRVPVRPRVRHVAINAAAQNCVVVEGAFPGFNEGTSVKVGVFVKGVFATDFININQIETKLHGVFQRDYLAPDVIPA